MKIAVEGCCHGSLDATYNQIAYLEKQNGYKVDLLLIGGDFQAIRNHSDLLCMAVPQKFRQLGQFHKYYTRQIMAPLLTIVIGGNHEASNYLQELYHGGWLAPNIYYLGAAGSVLVDGIRISGASGIFKYHDYKLGHYEKLPYDNSTMRSIYHIREYDTFKLMQLPSPEIFMSHDWPQGIEHHGDLEELLRRKPFFREDIQSSRLGSPPMMQLLRKLRPKKWFSAHLHVRFEATVNHVPVPTVANPDEIMIEDDDFDFDDGVQAKQDIPIPKVAEPSSGNAETQFLALDKCLPKRHFLEVIDLPTQNVARPAPSMNIPPLATPSAVASSLESETVSPELDVPFELDNDAAAQLSLPTSFGGAKSARKMEKQKVTQPTNVTPRLTFDPEWLAITRALHPFFSSERNAKRLPSEDGVCAMIERERKWIAEHLGGGEGKEAEIAIDSVQTFAQTAPGPRTGEDGRRPTPPGTHNNPQTEAFCNLLRIPNKINPTPQPRLPLILPTVSPQALTLPAPTQQLQEPTDASTDPGPHHIVSSAAWSPSAVQMDLPEDEGADSSKA